MTGLLALATAAIFLGAAAYISFAEHPARLRLADDAAWAQWGPAYKRGYIMQASLAIVSGVLGIASWWQSADLAWLAGALLMIANWPYTLLVIMPVNRRLEALASPAPAGTRDLLVRWGHLHAGRSLLGLLATLAFLAAALPPSP